MQVAFLISNSTCSLVVYKKTTSFYIIFISCNLAIISYQYQELFHGFFQMFYVDNQVVNKDSFISTFLICIPFLFFCFLPAIARTCSIMLKRDKRRHPCLLLDLNVKASSFHLSMMLAIAFSQIIFTKLRKLPSNPCLLRIFITTGCWILSNTFLHVLT